MEWLNKLSTRFTSSLTLINTGKITGYYSLVVSRKANLRVPDHMEMVLHVPHLESVCSIASKKANLRVPHLESARLVCFVLADYGVPHQVEMARFLLAKTLVAWARSLDSSFELLMLESNNDLDVQIKEESKEFE